MVSTHCQCDPLSHSPPFLLTICIAGSRSRCVFNHHFPGHLAFFDRCLSGHCHTHGFPGNCHLSAKRNAVTLVANPGFPLRSACCLSSGTQPVVDGRFHHGAQVFYRCTRRNSAPAHKDETAYTAGAKTMQGVFHHLFSRPQEQ